MNADGSGQLRLRTDGATDIDPSWSPDGSTIAFATQRGGTGQIYVMNADGSGQTKLTNNSSWNDQPTWSPDGAMIAYTSSNRDGNNEIYVMNADGSGQTKLTNNSVHETDSRLVSRRFPASARRAWRRPRCPPTTRLRSHGRRRRAHNPTRSASTTEVGQATARARRLPPPVR